MSLSQRTACHQVPEFDHLDTVCIPFRYHLDIGFCHSSCSGSFHLDTLYPAHKSYSRLWRLTLVKNMCLLGMTCSGIRQSTYRPCMFCLTSEVEKELSKDIHIHKIVINSKYVDFVVPNIVI